MRYLLDVNVLLAWEHQGSPHHLAFHKWAVKVELKNLLTCALSELGFLRISMQVFNYTLKESQDALTDIKQSIGGYIVQAPSPKLNSWATSARRTSDAYLLQLAKNHQLKLATFDKGIPDAEWIAM